MRYLQLESVIIPILNIRYIKQEEREGIEDGVEVIFLHTVIYFKDGSSLLVDEDFDLISEMLNPISQ